MIRMRHKIGYMYFVCFVLAVFLISIGLLGSRGFAAGTEENPYYVTTCEDLQDIQNDLDAYYVQTGNIDCSDSENWNGGEGFSPIGTFTGTYNGQNFLIVDIFIDQPDSDAVGLFEATNGAVITNIHLRDGTMDSENGGYNGTLVASATNTEFELCSSTTVINSVAQAGLVGNMSGGSMNRCWYSGDIDAGDNGYTAGLVAVASGADFSNVYTEGTLSGGTYSGALIGGLDGGTLTNAYSSMNVISTADTYSGGLTGYMSDQGVDGNAPNLTVSNVFFAGFFTESATAAGVITSFIDNTDFDGVYYDQDNCACATELGSGTPDTGSVTPVNTDGSDPNYFKGSTANEPMASWDFDTIWETYEGGFPTLRVDSQPADGDHDGILNAVEDAGPNDGDADGSGLLDSTEPYSASMPNPETGEYSVLVVSEQCNIISLDILGESDVSTPSDSAYNYPGGFMNFRINCHEVGFDARVTQIYYGLEDGDFIVRKYQPSTGYITVDGAEVSDDTIGEFAVKVAEYTVTDGSNYDIDGEADGFVEDPAGLGMIVESDASGSASLADTGSSLELTVITAISLLITASYLAFMQRHKNIIFKNKQSR